MADHVLARYLASSRHRWALGVLALAAVVILGLGFAGRQAQVSPGFCLACHQESFQAWQASGAAEDHSTCLECHRGSGWAGVIAAEFEALVNVTGWAFGGSPDSSNAHVPRSYCTQCHDSRDELIHQHHDDIPPRSPVTRCLKCHATDTGAIGRPNNVAASMTPSCGSCHGHRQERSFVGLAP